MRASSTTQELAAMSDEDFLAFIQEYSEGSQYEYAESFRYAALRLARMQGLTVKTNDNQKD